VTTFVPIHDRDERTLLRELTHRFHNELISSVNIVSAAAVRTENPEVKVALSNVVELLEQHVDVHRVLMIPDCGGLVDAAEYIRKLGFAMSRSCLEPVGIRLGLVADTLPLESERCWRLALAVYEIVTNAARHACFDGRDGAIKIKLSLADTVVNCIVADNGSLPARLKPARGLQVVSDLTKSLGGRIEYGFGAQFSSFLLVFPLTERERQANRVVASRRARGARQRKAMPPLSRSQAASVHSDRAGGGQENPAASELATEPAADAPVRREMENGWERI
jgi:two-component sensor histidine kinase